MARTRILTPKKDWKPAFLKRMCETGNVALSCDKAKVARQTVYAARGTDPAFAAAWDEAKVIAVEYLEGEAHRRAYEGTLRPVFHQGVQCGTIREYSDTLIIFLLKAHNPAKYRENSKVVVAGDPSAPVKHEHSVSITGDDVRAAAAVVAAAGLGVRPDG